MKLKLSVLFLGITILCNAQLNKIEFEEYDLKNGLHVILHEDNTAPNVVVSVMYHVGSKNEKPDRTGFAHFFEHLLFEGSENIERGEFDKYVYRSGGQNNANTTQDRTYYYEYFPSNELELGLWLESERMLHAKVQEVGIETQREVVKEERRLRIDNQPYGSVFHKSFENAFTEHPYRWSVIGEMEHLNAAEEADYKQFYEDYYIPQNAVLVLAGDFESAEAKKMVDKYFSTIPRGKKDVVQPSIVEPPLTTEIRDTVYDNIQLPAVVQVYRTPEAGAKDFYAVKMLNKLMSEGQSSRLYKQLVDVNQDAAVVGSFAVEMEDPGISVAYGIVNLGKEIADVEQAMDIEFKKVQGEKLSPREFEKIKNQVEAEFVMANSKVSGIAENLATYYTYFKDTERINGELEKYLAVTPEDIQRVAKKYYSKDKRVVLHYLPKPN